MQEKKRVTKFAKSVSHKVEKVGDKAKRAMSKTNLSTKEDTGDGSANNRTLPNKMNIKDIDGDSSYGPPVTTKYVGGSNPNSFRRKGSGRKNRDPGVQSDDEEDDMFKFDALSHRSSGSSLNVGNMGMVSKTSTPMSGSLEKIVEGGKDGNDLLRRSAFGTPVNARKDQAAAVTPTSTPRSSRGMMMDTRKKSNTNEPVMDEWEAKLLGKRSAGKQAYY